MFTFRNNNVIYIFFMRIGKNVNLDDTQKNFQ